MGGGEREGGVRRERGEGWGGRGKGERGGGGRRMGERERGRGGERERAKEGGKHPLHSNNGVLTTGIDKCCKALIFRGLYFAYV